MGAGPEQVVQGLDTVAGHDHRVGDLGLLQGHDRELDVVAVVLHQQDLVRPPHASPSSVK